MRRSSSYSVRSDRQTPRHLIHQGCSWSPSSSPTNIYGKEYHRQLVSSPSFLTIPSARIKGAKIAANSSNEFCQQQSCCEEASATLLTTNHFPHARPPHHSLSMSSASIQLLSSSLSPLTQLHQKHRSLPNERNYLRDNHDKQAATASRQQYYHQGVSILRRTSSSTQASIPTTQQQQQMTMRRNRSSGGSFKLARQNRTNSTGATQLLDNSATTNDHEKQQQEWSFTVIIRQLASNAFSSLYGYGLANDAAGRQTVILVQLMAIFNQHCASSDVQKLCHDFMLPAANLLDDLKNLFCIAAVVDDDSDDETDNNSSLVMLRKEKVRIGSIFCAVYFIAE